MWALGPTPRDNCILVLDWAAVYLCFVYMEGVELVIWRYTQLTVCNREAGCLCMAPSVQVSCPPYRSQPGSWSP